MATHPASDNRKSTAVTLRMLKSDHEKIFTLFSKYQIKSFAQLYDYLISSGIVYLKPKIVAFVRANIQKYKEDFDKDRARRTTGAAGTKRDYSTWQEMKMYMYDSEYIAYNTFCLEEKYKKQWIFLTLFVDGFINEHPDIIEHIKQCQKDKISENKRKIQKEANKKFVRALEPKDANKVLKILTKNYDEKKFDENIEVQIMELFKKDPNNDELKEQLNKLGKKLQTIRDANISKFVEMKAK